MGAEGVVSDCYKAGHCLCGDEGEQLRSFRAGLFAQLKAFSPRLSNNRSLLTNGYIVIRARREVMDTFFGDDGSEMVENTYKWMHVSCLLLGPYVPVFQPMEAVGITDGDIVPENQEIELQALATTNIKARL